ncbi:MAG: hypothetical protein R3325_03035, partial [Thermoanaerobaculia bacterium]|nr:hypothetical protein [Thermoanaerobaculia bacterium]
MTRGGEVVCPDCGTPISGGGWARGLCVPCLAELAVVDSLAEAAVGEAAHEAATPGSDADTLAQGGGVESPSADPSPG